MFGGAPLSLDEIEYDRLAWSLSVGEGYKSFFGIESTFRPPGYPVFLAIIYDLFGLHYHLARVIQAFLTASIGPLAYLIARKLLSERASIISGLLAGLFPTLFLFSFTLMSENLFMPALLLAVYLLIRQKDKVSLPVTILLSFVFLVLIFTRSELTLLVPILLLWLCLSSVDTKKSIISSCIITMIILFFAGIWSYRNYLIVDDFIYLDSKAGINLNIAFNEKSTGSFDQNLYDEIFSEYIKQNIKVAAPNMTYVEARRAFIDEWLAYKKREIPENENIDHSLLLNENWMNEYGKSQALQFIYQNPLNVIKMLPIKLHSFWNMDHRTIIFAYSNNVIGKLYNPFVIILCFLILAPFLIVTISSIVYLCIYSWSSNTLLLVLPIGFLTAIHSITFADARFHYPIVPFLCIFFSGLFFDKRARLNIVSVKNKFLMGFFLVSFLASSLFGLLNELPRYKVLLEGNGNVSYMNY